MRTKKYFSIGILRHSGPLEVSTLDPAMDVNIAGKNYLNFQVSSSGKKSFLFRFLVDQSSNLYFQVQEVKSL